MVSANNHISQLPLAGHRSLLLFLCLLVTTVTAVATPATSSATSLTKQMQ